MPAEKAAFEVEERNSGGERVVTLSGDWRQASLRRAGEQMMALEGQKFSGKTVIDISAVTHLDTSGAWLVRRLISASGGENGSRQCTQIPSGPDQFATRAAEGG